MDAMRPVARAVTVLAVLTLATVLSACDVVVTSLHAKGKAEDQWSRTYPMAASGEVEIVNTNGAITVVGADGSQVEVVAERTARAATDADAQDFLKQIEIREDVTGNHIRLETRTPRCGTASRCRPR